MRPNLLETDYKMEGKPSPHLKKVLKSYQLTAANTLNGPSSLLSRMENNSGSGTGNTMNNNSPNSSGNRELPKTLHIMKSNYSDPNGLIMEKISPGSAMSKLRSSMERERDEGSYNILSSREIKIEREEQSSHINHHYLKSETRYNTNNQNQSSSPPPPVPPQTPKGLVNRSFSSSESSTISSGSTSTSPVSQYNDCEMSPPRPALRDRTPEEITAIAALSGRELIIREGGAISAAFGGGFHSQQHHSPSSLPSGLITPLPKKLLHRHQQQLQIQQQNHFRYLNESRMQQMQHERERQQQQQQQQQRSGGVANNPLGALHQHFPQLQKLHHLSSVSQFQPPPIFSAPDKATTEKRETPLEGEYISCFVVGGEKRLCFPQILTTVLRPFSLPQINQVCDELQIFCSRCSVEQLEILKMTGVLPMSANSCGLITKTDAERLVTALLHRNPPKAAVGSVAARNGLAASSQVSFRVFHECFGKCKGIVLANLYDKLDSLCIECVECHGLFSPSRFVAHAHHRQEVRTCHWGFDSAKWRHYLMIARDQEDKEKWGKVLEEFKAKFDHKRKESVRSIDEIEGRNGEDQVVIKRIRFNGDMIGQSSPDSSPPASSPAVTIEPALYLPTKKRLPFIQCSDNDQSNLNGFDGMDSIKKMLLSRLDNDGADKVIRVIDKMSNKISSLEQICRNQEKFLKRVTEAHSGTELQAKMSSMEAELHSLKKQLLRRHEQREVI